MSLLFLKTPAGTASDTEYLNILLELFCPLKMYSGSFWSFPACSINVLNYAAAGAGAKLADASLLVGRIIKF